VLVEPSVSWEMSEATPADDEPVSPELGVRAERRSLEGIAKPLTAVESAVRSGVTRARRRTAPATQ
jgi:hypothetical protein